MKLRFGFPIICFQSDFKQMMFSYYLNSKMNKWWPFWSINFNILKLPYFLKNKWYWDLFFTQMFSISNVKCWCEKGKNLPKSCKGERQDHFMISFSSPPKETEIRTSISFFGCCLHFVEDGVISRIMFIPVLIMLIFSPRIQAVYGLWYLDGSIISPRTLLRTT